MTQKWIKEAATKIMSDLDDRSLGLDSVDADIREEIQGCIEAIIKDAHEAATYNPGCSE